MNFGNLFLGSYVEGAKSATAGKPLIDGNLEANASTFPRQVRKQTHWLNVNGTDTPTMVSSLTVRTVGVSISVQVESPSPSFNKEAELLIEEHARLGVGELTGRHHFNSSVRLISDFDILDGGIIIRHHYNNDWNIPYKYELVGVDMIDVSKTQHIFAKDGDFTTINGIVRNKWGQITHLWLYSNENKTRSEKVPYGHITYYSDTWVSLDQITAISKLASMLKTMDQSLQYGEATLNSAIEAAKAGAYLQSQAYDEVMRVVSEAVAAEVPNASSRNSIATVVDIVKPILHQFSNIGVKPHGVTPIASGDNIIFDPTARDNQYKALNDNNEMKMSSSLGMSKVGTYKQLSDANYSAIKAGMEMDQQSADVRFDNIKNKILFDIHTRLIEVGVQTGRIRGRFAYWKKPTAFNKFRYLRQNKIDIERSKNALANKTNIELGIDTEADIIETMKGIKYEAWLDKDIEQRELKARKMLDLEVKLAKQRKEAFEAAGLDDIDNGDENE